MTPEIWIPEAEDLRAAGSSNTMYGTGGPRATLHCTVSRPTQFDDMHDVLIAKKAEPHLLYSFADDRLGQYFALDRSARALMGSDKTPSGISHNRTGLVNIQVEVVGTTDDWSARDDWRPGPNFRAMLRAIRSHGIVDRFIFRPATTSADRANVVRPLKTLTSDAGGGVWWGHCHYPDGESHWDPGRIDLDRFFAAAPHPNLQEDDMQLSDKVTVADPDNPGKTKEVTVEAVLARASWAYHETVGLKAAASKMLANQAADKVANDAILKAIADGATVDLDAVRAASREGSAQAITELVNADVEVNVALGQKATP